MKPVRRHPYKRVIVVMERWHVPYAPAYGWREELAGAIVCRIVGHKPVQKFTCRICGRCRVMLHVEGDAYGSPGRTISVNEKRDDE